jgi:hypothetical protein
MPEVIHGSDVVIEMLVDDEYFPILCGTDCTFSRTPEFIPVTSAGSGLFRDFLQRREEWTMSVTGCTKVENDTVLTFFYMLQTSVRRAAQTIRITFTDDEGSAKQISGSAFIGQMSINGPQGDFSQGSIEFRGTGAYEIITIEPPTVVEYDILSDWWETESGENFIDGASAIYGYSLQNTDEILVVAMEGNVFYLTNGTPGSGQCQFTTSPARITFASDMVFDGNQRVFVEFKRPV